MQMDRAGAAAVAHESQCFPEGDRVPRVQICGGALQVAVHDEIFAYGAGLRHVVLGHDTQAEQVTDEQNLAVADLVLEVERVNGSAARRRPIHAAVPDRLELRASPLLGVRLSQVVVAADERAITRDLDGQVVVAIVGAAFRATRDVVIANQVSRTIAVLVFSHLRRLPFFAFGAVGNGDTGAVIR
jgi:hypothetical protein